MMFIQNLTGYWQSWAYSWTIILVLVGLGIFIMGLYTEDLQRRQAGLRVMKVGAILFIIFGGFFELILNAFRPYGIQQYLFPVLLVALGIYLVVVRSGMLSSRRIDANNPTIDLSEVKK
jgi:multisubunit Na+/H+ antiporter MnhC subunit